MFEDIEKLGDIPLGLSRNLMMHQKAMNHYLSLAQEEKNKIIEYIENCQNGYEVKDKLEFIISSLEKNNTDFLSTLSL